MFSVRRTVILALGCSLMLSACGGKSAIGARSGASAETAARAAAASTGKVLNLYIWSDYLAPNTLSDFEKQTGIKVHVAYFDTNETLGDQAARGQQRLRRRGADGLVLRAPDQGRRLLAARQIEAAESEEHGPAAHGAGRHARSRQRARRDLHVGHQRHRLQREDGEGVDARCAARQLAAGVRSGGRLEGRQVRHQRARLARRDDARGAQLPRARIRTRRSRRIWRRRRPRS